MADTPHHHPIEFQTVRKGYDPSQVDSYRADIEARLTEAQQRSETLDRRLRKTSEEAADLLGRLDAEAERSAVAEQQLAEALEREESVRLMLQEASKTRNRVHSEAEAVLEQAHTEASDESERIVRQAMDKASTIVAEAKKERRRLMNSGQDELAVLEADAAARIADLEDHNAELSDRIDQVSVVYSELVHTLQTFLDTSQQSLLRAATARPEADASDEPQPRTSPHEAQVRDTA